MKNYRQELANLLNEAWQNEDNEETQEELARSLDSYDEEEDRDRVYRVRLDTEAKTALECNLHIIDTLIEAEPVSRPGESIKASELLLQKASYIGINDFIALIQEIADPDYFGINYNKRHDYELAKTEEGRRIIDKRIMDTFQSTINFIDSCEKQADPAEIIFVKDVSLNKKSKCKHQK